MALRLTLFTFGSRGDVQPYLALGRGLQAAGMQVRIATSRYHEPLLRRSGIDFYPLTNTNPQQLLHSEAGLRWLETGRNPLASLRAMRRLGRGLLDEQLRNVLQASQDADALLYSVTTMLAVAPVAEALGIPAAGAWLQPFHPTRHFPALFFPEWPRGLPLRGRYNRLSHELQLRLAWRLVRDDYNAVLGRQLGLPPARAPFNGQHTRPDPVVYGFSRYLLPQPPAQDALTAVSGYWFHDEADWSPPPRLTAFLRAGPPPLCIGFGSMTERDAGRTTALILDALRQTGLRAVLLSGWAGLGGRELPPTVLRLDYAPHAWLFPRMAGLVHHGGAGTTGAGLRAGVPALLIPRFADQPFQARRLRALGVSPPWIAHRRLTAARLARGLRQLTSDAALRERAAVLGARVRAEDGVGLAVNFLTRALERSPRRPRAG